MTTRCSLKIGGKVLEREIEKKVCSYAKSLGVMNIKQQGTMGVPDRLFLYKGKCMFIEFKRKGGKTRPTQVAYINKLTLQGVHTVVVDNVVTGKEYIDNFIKGE